MNELSLVQRTFASLVNAGADPTKVKIPNLLALIPDALELLGKRVAAGDDYEGLQMDFDVTPIAGVADLAVVSDGILFDLARARVRVAASDVTLQPIDSLETLQNGDLPNDQVWYAQEGSTLRFRSTTPSLTNYVTPVKVKANYIPSLLDAALPLPFQYESALVLIMVELAHGDATPMEARELTETGRT